MSYAGVSQEKSPRLKAEDTKGATVTLTLVSEPAADFVNTYGLLRHRRGVEHVEDVLAAQRAVAHAYERIKEQAK